MLYLIDTTAVKPNRIDTPNKDTNEEYHAQYAKFCIGNTNRGLHSTWVEKTKVNKRFYKGDQWIDKEDIEAFLKDDTGQDRNRIQIVHNVVRPMVEQYRGNAIRMSINVDAKSMSTKAVNRREIKLGEQLFYTDMANQIDSFSNYIRKRYNVGRDKDETKKIFDNLYVDTFANDISELVKEVARRNDFPQLQLQLAENLAFSGLAVLEGFEFAGHLRYEVVPSEQFFWDTQAKRNDFKDADYMGKLQEMLPTDVYEQWPDIGRDNMISIENYVTSFNRRIMEYGASMETSTRVPVFSVYWRDCDEHTYGYVMDGNDYKYCTRINFTYPGEDKPRYTDKDLVTPPNTPRARYLFKNGAKKRKLRMDVLRYCIIIPGELLGTNNENKKYSDIVLEYGVYPYQDTELEDPTNVQFPFKCQAWSYVDGEVLSPVDDVINPQRFINRVMSVTESQINNSGGTNIVYSDDAITSQDGESEILRNVGQGKPIKVRTKGQGVPNAIGYYDATPKAGTYGMFGLIGNIKGLIQDTTGINEAIKGESTGSDQLVGVTQILLQRGTLMQEPFYYALSEVFMQAHQYTANVGKRIYIDNERELAIMVGDEGVKTLRLSKDLKTEDFRVYVKRENVDEILIGQADQMLLTLRQMELIDDSVVANLFGRSTPSDVSKFLRQYSRDKIEAARIQADNNKTEMAAVQGQIANDQKVQQNINQYNRAQDFAEKSMLQDKKNEGALATTIAKTLGQGIGK